MRLAPIALAAMLAASPAIAQPRYGGVSGVWLVAATMRDKITGRGLFASDAVIEAAARCGFDFRPQDAAHFAELDKALTVIGNGPYASDTDARSNLRELRKCVPGARLERLTYY